MSIFEDFAKTGFAASREIIGGNTLSIQGGTGISVVGGDRSDARGYESGGYEADVTFEVVAAKAEFEAAYTAATRTYLGKTATLSGRTYRVQSIRFRSPVYIIALGSNERGA